MNLDDIAIGTLVEKGDKEAFAELIRRYHPKVMGLCRSFFKNEETAEDAAQDVFIKVFKNLNSFKKKSSLGTWIYRIAYNHCLDVLRQTWRKESSSLEALAGGEEPHHSLAIHSAQTPTENADLISKIMGQLSPDERIILSLRELSGLNYNEIADTLDISMDAVKSRLKRARQKLLEIGRHFLKANNV